MNYLENLADKIFFQKVCEIIQNFRKFFSNFVVPPTTNPLGSRRVTILLIRWRAKGGVYENFSFYYKLLIALLNLLKFIKDYSAV